MAHDKEDQQSKATENGGSSHRLSRRTFLESGSAAYLGHDGELANDRGSTTNARYERRHPHRSGARTQPGPD